MKDNQKESLRADSVFESLSDIASCEFSESFYMESDNLYYHAKEIFVGYEGCPVGTQLMGFIGNINDKWVLIKTDYDEVWKSIKNSELKVYECNVISDEYTTVLAESKKFLAMTAEKLCEDSKNHP